jgi:hypothetical protein
MMADIDVVPKRGTKTWLWILIALAVLIVLWFVFAGSGSPARQVGQLLDHPAAPVWLSHGLLT